MEEEGEAVLLPDENTSPRLSLTRAVAKAAAFLKDKDLSNMRWDALLQGSE